MKNICFLFLLTIIIFSCQNNGQQTTAKDLISKVKKEFVKDGRTKLFKLAANDQNGKISIKGETNLPDAKTRLLTLLEEAKIPFLDSIEVLPSLNLEGKNYGVVRLSVCNIRSKPKHSAELATQALMGTFLRVLKEENGWYLVQTPDDYLGWLDKGGFTLLNSDEQTKWGKYEKVIILAEFARVYAESSLSIADSTEVVSDLVYGNILIDKGLSENDDQMRKVELPDGRQGFVIRRSCTKYWNWRDNVTATGEDIVATARRFMGVPYLWGGTSTKGFDCSGFTKTVYLGHGLQLERDASLQVHTGLKIETDTSTWKNLLPGDLLFFGREATSEKKERISHVAIWMGDGKVIHAAELVKIESLIRGEKNFAENRVKTFIRAKRMIGVGLENGIVALKKSEWY
ncbi:MAG: hypothetical protein ACI9XO_000060 [Paraglaciecola sp.]|jgi:hypothetical protein